MPYLYQRDGTSGEHLPETHAFIKRIRKQIDADYPGRILLAEANGWPSDVADYFGDGDECHLCFHFPLMPRLFMAVRREQRYPITEILAQTPVIDDACQWAIFLRNHDELTLEQVSDEERDYLMAEYAKDPRMKRHMGIGRRLAPLLDNDRRTAELLYALILSLPGSPVIYYGDELLMGDNIYLGDRDSVRTPMQWSPDRNGGFSKADFAQLYLPPLMDPVYGFSALNVEAQLRNQGSFLHWLRRMLTERRALPVMGVGTMEVLPCANPSVLAYMRSGEVADILTGSTTTPPSVSPAVGGALDWGHSTVLARTVPAGNESEGDEAVHRHQAVLCVHNLSRFAQPAELALAKWAGATPYEVLGRVPFPVITEEPYAVTLPPYGFLWFDLALEEGRAAGMTAERDQALRTLTEAWLGLRRVAPEGDDRHRAGRGAPGRPAGPDRHRGPGGGAAGAHRRGVAGRGRRAPLPPRRRGGGARPARRRGRAGRLHRRAARRPAGRAAARHGARRRGPSRTGGGPARRRRRHGARLRRPGRPPRVPVARRGAAARRRSHGGARGVRLQPRRRPAGALDLGGERPRGGAGAAGRPLRRAGRWP